MGKDASASDMCLPEWLLARTAMSEEWTLGIRGDVHRSGFNRQDSIEAGLC